MLYYTNASVTNIPSIQYSKEEVEKLCLNRNINYKDGFEKRVILFDVANEEVDPANRKIIMAGGCLNGFVTNPVVLWYHTITDMVGYSLKEEIGANNVLQSLILFLQPDNLKKDTLFQMVSTGFIKAASLCINIREAFGSNGPITFTKWDLLEISICSIWYPSLNTVNEVIYNEVRKKYRVDDYKGLLYEIYPNENNHNIEHFHVNGSGTTDAVFRIDNGTLISGYCEPRDLVHISIWYEKNKNLLWKIWHKTRPK